jgi:hypothetical protein
MVLAATCVSPSAALAQYVVNFDVKGANTTPLPPTYSGAGVVGSGTYWNVLQAQSSYGAGTITSTTSYADNGTTVTGVTMSETSAFGYSSGWPGNSALLDDYLQINSSGTASFAFTNLTSGVYNLVLFSASGSYAGSRTTFTVNGQSQGVTNTTDASLVAGDNYVIYNNLIVLTGALSGTFTAGTGKSQGFLCGAQLQYLNINLAPAIITDVPSTQNAAQGSKVQFTVTATGYPVPAYRWQYSTDGVYFANLSDNSNVSGSASNILTLPHVAANQAGYYQVVVSNTAGSVNSSVAQLTVNVLPAPWTVNFDLDTYAGGFVGTYSGAGVIGSGTYWNSIDAGGSGGGGTFSSTAGRLDDNSVDSGVTATVTAPGTWSWNPVNNALLDDYAFTKSGAYTFSFSNLPDGIYDLVLFGVNGGYTNGETVFTVSGQSLSDSNSTDTAFVQGDNYVQFPTVLVQGGTLAGTYAPAAGASEGDFCGAQLQYCGTTNLVVAPGILTPPASVTNYQNFPASFSVQAYGNPLNYQWQFSLDGVNFSNLTNNSNIGGATSRILMVTNTALNEAGSYRVVVSNSGGSTNSPAATLTVQALATPWVVNFDYNASGSNPPTTWVGTFENDTGTNQLWFPYLSSTNAYFFNAIFGASNANQHVVSTSSSSSGTYLGGWTDDGLNLTRIVCTVTGYGASYSNRATGYSRLLDDFATSYSSDGSDGNFSFGNLPSGYYNLAVFSVNGDLHSDKTLFTIGGVSVSCTNSDNSYLVQGDNYVVYQGLHVTGGSISGTYVPTGGSSAGVFCGAQLQYVGTTAGPTYVTLSAAVTADGKIVLQWPQGTLQTNANLGNSAGWSTVTGATSPYTNATPASAAKLFYRVHP